MSRVVIYFNDHKYVFFSFFYYSTMFKPFNSSTLIRRENVEAIGVLEYSSRMDMSDSIDCPSSICAGLIFVGGKTSSMLGSRDDYRSGRS